MTVMESDISRVLQDYNLDFSRLSGKTILVTGATGLVGSLLVRSFLAAGNIRVLASVRNLEKARAIFGDTPVYLVGDICEPIWTDLPVDYIIHCAAVTTSKLMVEQPVETLNIAFKGTENLLRLAMEKKPECFLYISSMEVYGTTEQSQNPVAEDQLGFVNLSKVRSVYPEGKRVCELMCAAYASEYGIPVRIARLAQTFGAGVPKGDNRVFMQFVRSALDGRDIVLHTEGKSLSNFCYSSDAIAGIMTILLKGENGASYNVCNDGETRSIRKIAELVAEKLSNGRSSVVIDIPQNADMGYAPDSVMRLSAEKLRALGWKPQVSMEQAYRNLCVHLQE